MLTIPCYSHGYIWIFFVFRVRKEYYAPALGGIMLSIGIQLSVKDFVIVLKRLVRSSWSSWHISYFLIGEKCMKHDMFLFVVLGVTGLGQFLLAMLLNI